MADYESEDEPGDMSLDFSPGGARGVVASSPLPPQPSRVAARLSARGAGAGGARGAGSSTSAAWAAHTGRPAGAQRAARASVESSPGDESLDLAGDGEKERGEKYRCATQAGARRWCCGPSCSVVFFSLF